VVTATVAPGPLHRRVAFDAQVRGEIERHRGRLLALSTGEVQAAFDGPARAIRCAAALAATGQQHGRRIRAGLHTGECESIGGAIRGPAVGVSDALSRHASDGEVLVSRTVVDLVAGSGLEFEPRGELPLAQQGGPFDVFAARVPGW
jgi:class 3 adenylate cyclase